MIYFYGRVIIPPESSEKTSKYNCHLCDKEFKYKHYLREHMYTHSNLKKYICPYCDYGFHQLGNLKRHTSKKHPGQPPLLCPCGKGFFQATHLRHHFSQAHSGKTLEKSRVVMPDILRPEEIKTQGVQTLKTLKKSRIVKPNIIKQEKIKKPKPAKVRAPSSSDYRCCICYKLFRRRDTLRSHELIHLGNKGSKCLYCNYSCNQLSNLKRHVMRKHPGKPPLMCPQCGLYFQRSYDLRKHRSEVHLEKYRDIRPPDPCIVEIELPEKES